MRDPDRLVSHGIDGRAAGVCVAHRPGRFVGSALPPYGRGARLQERARPDVRLARHVRAVARLGPCVHASHAVVDDDRVRVLVHLHGRVAVADHLAVALPDGVEAERAVDDRPGRHVHGEGEPGVDLHEPDRGRAGALAARPDRTVLPRRVHQAVARGCLRNQVAEIAERDLAAGLVDRALRRLRRDWWRPTHFFTLIGGAVKRRREGALLLGEAPDPQRLVALGARHRGEVVLDGAVLDGRLHDPRDDRCRSPDT